MSEGFDENGFLFHFQITVYSHFFLQDRMLLVVVFFVLNQFFSSTVYINLHPESLSERNNLYVDL